MLEYRASAHIAASAATVWEILTDVAAYPEWDPICERIEGTLGQGKKLKAYSTLMPGRGFKLKVMALEPGVRMVWRGGMPLGLFRGERSFVIEQHADGTVSFTLSEVFSGPMLGLIRKSLPDFTEPFKKTVAGLKAHAEKIASTKRTAMAA